MASLPSATSETPVPQQQMSGLTLTPEQAAVLLPLLQQRLSLAESAPAHGKEEAPPFTVADMLRKKKKNARSTAAQNFLLVSVCKH